MTGIERRLAGALGDELASAGVPGAAAAILHEGQIHEAAAGVLNVETKVATTPDSVFQIGSITKTLVATMVMQLVEAGTVDLDAPVRRYLPEFRVASAEATEGATVRQLLSHSGGFEGDLFVDCGTGPQSVERYVSHMSGLAQAFAPGWGVNYCNAGFVVLGRLLEVLTGTHWDELLQQRIADPLGAPSILTRAEEMLRYRVAVGHVRDPRSQAYGLPKVLHLPYAMGPAGSTAVATARDLVRFARAHMNGGMTETGERLLAPDTVALMQEPQASLPSPQWTLHHRGLGWVIYDWSETVIGHDGGTVGQVSFLRFSPKKNFAMALFTNGGEVAKRMYDALFREFFRDLSGIAMPKAPAPSTKRSPATERVLGRYESMRTQIDVFEEDGLLKLRTSPKDENEHERTAEAVIDLAPVSDYAFRTYTAGNEAPDAIVFHELGEAGIPRVVTIRTRAYVRVDG